MSTNSDALVAEFQDQEARTALILENALDAIVAMGSCGQIIDWNRQAEAVFGWQKAEVLGKQLSTIIIPERFREAHEQGMRRFLSTGVPRVLGQRLELSALHRDGHEFPVELAIAPPGKLKGEYVFSAFIRDISERKKAEASLKAAHEQLNEQNRLLEGALADARVAAQAKSTFLATMSHEIRTPMHGILSMVGFLLRTRLDREQQDFAVTIQQCSESLLQIINDILDFSKMDAGKLSLERMPFEVRRLVEDVLQMFVVKADEKQIELGALVAANVPRQLTGDPGRLRQILVNLVGNAVKFTNSGEVIVHVTRHIELEDSVSLRLAITDTGPGIAAEFHPHLFQAFHQGDGSTTRKYGGTGLGLAICKQLAELMGGEIGVTSMPGNGASFWFTASFGRAAIQPVPDGRTTLESRRFCIVDDNATNRVILENHCRHWGAEYVSAGSAEEGLCAIRSAFTAGTPFDVAIIDLQMPKMDGLQLAQALQQGHPDLLTATRLVLLTSVGLRGDAARAQAVGFSAYLVKPVRESELKDCLEALLTSGSTPPLNSDESGPPLVTRHSLGEQLPEKTSPILVAEDDVINQKVAVRMLKELGYQADVVSTGEEAIEAVGKRRYGAILMDCRMPGMDGYLAAASIRANEPPGDRIPIIAMTADAMPENRKKSLAAGMDDYMTKPVGMEMLGQLLGRWVRHTAAPAESCTPPEGDVLDMKIFKELQALDAELLSTLIDHFVSQWTGGMRKLEDALMRADYHQLAEIAHSIKGQARNLGIRPTAKLAGSLQETAEQQDPERARVLLHQLKNSFPQVKHVLDCEQAALNGSPKE